MPHSPLRLRFDIIIKDYFQNDFLFQNDFVETALFQNDFVEAKSVNAIV
jgi:hypothetical protein